MRILIISASSLEVGFKAKSLVQIGKTTPIEGFVNHDVDLLVTGVGAVPCAFFTARFADQYQLVVNIGIAGSYRLSYPVGAVVCVKEDSFGDYGVDDKGSFLSLFESRLIGENQKPFQGDLLVNPYLKGKLKPDEIPLVNGITLATASGSLEKIELLRKQWNPDIETMEGAAVFYVCNMLDVPFICIRSISNMVEPRDRSKWEIKKAVDSVTSFTSEYINNLPLSF